MYFTYDIKLLYENNFIERLDNIKRLVDIWFSRGLSVFGKVTIIKSFLIPKVVYVFSVFRTQEFVKEFNQLFFKFPWNGTGKVTINEYQKEG